MEKVLDTHSSDGVGVLGTWVYQELDLECKFNCTISFLWKAAKSLSSLKRHSRKKFFVSAVLSGLSQKTHLKHIWKICCCAYSLVAGRAAEQSLILLLVVPWLNAQKHKESVSACPDAGTERTKGKTTQREMCVGLLVLQCTSLGWGNMLSWEHPSSHCLNKQWQMLLNSASCVKTYKDVN